MIHESIQRQFAELRKLTGSECYVVRIFSPYIVLALVVPRGGKGKETVNPENIDVDLVGDDEDWGLVERPTLAVFTSRNDDADKKVPRLSIVPPSGGDAA